MVLNLEKAVNNINDTSRPLRHERKFCVESMTKEEVEYCIKMLPEGFTEIHRERFVNSIYLEKSSFKSFFENVDGLPNRTKFRIRWYGQQMGLVETPILELKIKDNQLGTKELYHLKPFELDKHFGQNDLEKSFKLSDLPPQICEELQFLRPVLLNRYRRKYFISANNNYRITLDDGVEFCLLNQHNNSFLKKRIDREHVIVEMKYDCNLDNEARLVTSRLPFRMTKNSKYVQGVFVLY
jgi:SPX domain protein involved in polyphosphate accumulation